MIHVPVTNLDHTQEITPFHDTLLLIDHRLDLEILNILNLAPILRHETKSITFNHKLLLTQSTLKNTCTIQQKMANALTPTSWFYSLYTHTSSNQNHRDYPSRLEISFLLDSGASISVLNHPTYITIAKLLNIKQNIPHNSSKTLTVANQTEVLILHYITITLNTTIEDDSRPIHNTLRSS